MATLAERFNALVDRTGAHHPWLGTTDQRGIPQIRVDGRLTTARRVAWALHHGPLPRGAESTPAPPTPAACAANTSPSPNHAFHRQAPTASVELARRVKREIRPGVWKLTITTETHRRVSHTITADRATADELARLAAEHGHPPATLDACS